MTGATMAKRWHWTKYMASIVIVSKFFILSKLKWRGHHQAVLYKLTGTQLSIRLKARSITRSVLEGCLFVSKLVRRVF